MKLTLTALSLMLAFGFMSEVRAAEPEGVALYKHDENGHKSTQGFVDPKAAIGRHPDSVPQMDKSEVNCETYPDSCKSSIIVH